MSVLSRFGTPNGNNSYEGKGIKSGNDRADFTAIPYAAVIDPGIPSRKAFRHYYDFAQLTGNLTLNFASVANFEEGDEIYFQFSTDGSTRTITWGTNIRPGVAGTFAPTLNTVGLVKAMFMNAKIHILSQTFAAV